jgi:hemerythrin
MQWIDDYALGIQEIDDQHKNLLAAFSNIERTIAAQGSWSEIHFLVIQLKGLANTHFEFEEALMRLFAYEEIVGHKDRHEQFLTALMDIERASIHLPDDGALCKRLGDWFRNHMSVCDRGYAEHIRSGASVVMLALGNSKSPATGIA